MPSRPRGRGGSTRGPGASGPRTFGPDADGGRGDWATVAPSPRPAPGTDEAGSPGRDAGPDAASRANATGSTGPGRAGTSVDDETQALPRQIADLVLRHAPDKSTTLELHEPQTWARAGQTEIGGMTSQGQTGLDAQVGYNRDNGAGGVSAAPEAAPRTSQPSSQPDLTSPLPTGLIPDQPLAPGAPPSLAAAMGAGLSPLSTPSTGLSTVEPHEPKARARDGNDICHSPTSPAAGLVVGDKIATEAPPQRLAPLPDLGLSAEDKKKFGHAHPYKPSTPDQVASFGQMWFDSAYTNDQIARHYRTTERTVVRWRTEFGMPPRPEALKQAAAATKIVDSAESVVKGLGRSQAISHVVATQVKSQAQAAPVDPVRFDPLMDSEVVQALENIRAEARIMTAHSDLQPLQRKLMRLSVLAATKMPTMSWSGLTVMIESLQRTILNSRRIEADIPTGGADPVVLRKEAASALFKEMKSVLTADEQETLARVVKLAADRLMARGASADTLVTEAEGRVQ